MNHTIINVPEEVNVSFSGLNEVFGEIAVVQEELLDTGLLDEQTQAALKHLVGFQAVVRAATAAEELNQALQDLVETQSSVTSLEQQADGLIDALRNHLKEANTQGKKMLKAMSTEGKVRRSISELLAIMVEFSDQIDATISDMTQTDVLKDNAIQSALDLRDVLTQLRDVVLADDL